MLLDVHAELLCEVVTVRFPSTDRGVQTLMLSWQANLLSHLFLWSISFFFWREGQEEAFYLELILFKSYPNSTPSPGACFLDTPLPFNKSSESVPPESGL